MKVHVLSFNVSKFARIFFLLNMYNSVDASSLKIHVDFLFEVTHVNILRFFQIMEKFASNIVPTLRRMNSILLKFPTRLPKNILAIRWKQLELSLHPLLHNRVHLNHLHKIH